MKTFKDLVFEEHPSKKLGTGLDVMMFGTFGEQARMEFDNGYGVSVITGGSGVYASKDAPYELAVLHNGSITYDTPITSDVVGHLTEQGVSDLMVRVQELKERR